MEYDLQILVPKGTDVLIGFEKAEEAVGLAKKPMVTEDIVVLFQLDKNIARKNRGGRMNQFPFPPDIYFPLGKVDRQGDPGMEGLKKFYIPFLSSGFYLDCVIIHRLNKLYNKFRAFYYSFYLFLFPPGILKVS
jgi:hypothetical protein